MIFFNNQKTNVPGNILLKIFLFWSVFILVVFFEKKFFKYPSDNYDYLIKNLATFMFTVIITGSILKFVNNKTIIFVLASLWITIFILVL